MIRSMCECDYCMKLKKRALLFVYFWFCWFSVGVVFCNGYLVSIYIIGPLSACHRNAIRMAFRWWEIVCRLCTLYLQMYCILTDREALDQSYAYAQTVLDLCSPLLLIQTWKSSIYAAVSGRLWSDHILTECTDWSESSLLFDYTNLLCLQVSSWYWSKEVALPRE